MTSKEGDKSIIGRHTLRYFEIGVIAIFGVDDEESRRLTAYTMASLSQRRAALKFSKMGEVIPLKPDNYREEGGKTWNELSLKFRERFIIDKSFIIAYLEFKAEDGRDAFAFVNVRGDRIDNLIALGTNDNESYRISDYATLILQDYDKPSASDWENLKANYLYDREYVNVRIFPPLSEVT